MTTSYAKDIRPLFTDIDVAHMRFFVDLSSYGDVKQKADVIFGRLTGAAGPIMPPAIDNRPWPQANIDLFRQWQKDGCPP